MAGYVLATAFDEIWLQPGGELGLLGVGLETTFVRGALDRLGMEPQFEQRYEYKNAADQLMRTEFTPAHREALDRLAESVFADGGRRRSPQGRQLDPAVVRDPGRPGTAHLAAGGAGRRAGRPARLPRRGLCRDPDSGSAAAPSCCSPTGGGRVAGSGCPAGRPGTSPWCEVRGVSLPGTPGAARWAARPAATRSAPRCARPPPTTGPGPWCCPSIRRADRRWRPRRSGGRYPCSSEAQARRRRRWARSRRPAATTSPARPIGSSRCRPP